MEILDALFGEFAAVKYIQYCNDAKVDLFSMAEIDL